MIAVLKRGLVGDRDIAAANRNSRNGLPRGGQQYGADEGLVGGRIVEIKHVWSAISRDLTSANVVANRGELIAIDHNLARTSYVQYRCTRDGTGAAGAPLG